MKKSISLILALVMLMGMLACAPVSAESALVTGEILNSIDEDTDLCYSVAFLVTANVSGMDSKNYIADYTNATVEYNGTTAKVVEMGTMVTNNADVVADIENLCVGTENGYDVIRIPVVHLYNDPQPEDTQCVFATRIVRIPAVGRSREITARPYFILQVEGTDEQTIVYTDADCATYLEVWSDSIAVPAEKIALADQVYLEKITTSVVLDPADNETPCVSATFPVRNDAPTAVVGSTLNYTCYDAAGTAVKNGQIDISDIGSGVKKDYVESVPAETAEIVYDSSSIRMLPVLPAIGSDIDVTKKKNRIRVSAALATLNEDGTYHVTLTFRNYTSNWITEETDYVVYTCYDATDTVVQTGTNIYIGCIDTKKNPMKTFEFDVPATTAEVKLTSSKIVYWTEWA